MAGGVALRGKIIWAEETTKWRQGGFCKCVIFGFMIFWI